jgi:hypothetical protein
MADQNTVSVGTVVELAWRVGLTADMIIGVGSDSIAVRVRINDLRTVWNRVDALVAPIAGSGTTWVCTDRLTLIPEEVSA